MASIIYNNWLEDTKDGTQTPSSDAYKVMLLTNAYTPNQAHVSQADVEANEVTDSGSGYTAGGETCTVTVAPAGNTVITTFAGQTFSATDFQGTGAKFAVYMRDAGGVATDNRLACISEFAQDKLGAGVDWTLADSTITDTNNDAS